MFLFPYSTDAPVYHWPYATVGLIVANTLLFLGVDPASVTPDSPWMVGYGAGLRPEQWFGALFMHAGFFHLLGNLMFLWVFGLVVEGKLGAPRFLACYLTIGVGQAAVEQLGMLGYSGDATGSLGASSAIYGVMAMAAVWAPDNSVNFFYWLVFPGTFEAPIGGVAFFYVGCDMLLAVIFGGYAASSLLHVMGAAMGFPLGILLLKRGVVDCEGWDLFTRHFPKVAAPADRNGNKTAATDEPLKANPPETRESAERSGRLLGGAADQFDAYLAAGNVSAATTLHRKMAGVGDGLRLDAPRLRALIQGLQAEQRWADLAPYMAELVEAAPQHADAVRVKLAQVCVTKLDRPGRALELIGAASVDRLSEQQRSVAEKIEARARQMQLQGVVELDDGGW